MQKITLSRLEQGIKYYYSSWLRHTMLLRMKKLNLIKPISRYAKNHPHLKCRYASK